MLCVTSACALFPSLDDLRDHDAQALDASADIVDATAFDVDAADITDANADAADVGFCAAHPTAAFCADFDDGNPLTSQWTLELLPSDAAVLLVDSDASTSHPSAMLASVPVNPTASTMKADGLGLAGTTTKGAHLEFDLLLEADDPSGGLFFMSLRFGQGADANKYILTLHTAASGQVDLQEQGPSDAQVGIQSPLSSSPKIGSWSHMALDVDLEKPAVTVTMNGVVVLGPQAPKTATTTGGVSLRAGIMYSVGPSATLRCRLDNVLVALL